MARNKYPEKTVEKIIQVSLQLFSEKGYEKTTIQDIVNALGMSKGAIYHHFKSKEEIIDAICYQCYHGNAEIQNILQAKHCTALEKLKLILKAQMSDTHKLKVDHLSMDVWKNPKFFMMGMRENLNQNAVMVQRLLEEGMQDGSVSIQEPMLTSQVAMLLMNYWIHSPVTQEPLEVVIQKIHFFRKLMESMNVPVIDDEIEAMMCKYFTNLCNDM